MTMPEIKTAVFQFSNSDWLNLVFEDGSLGSCSLTSPEIASWLQAGNTPLPAPDPIPEPEPLTPEQKLAASGLTVEELKELLGL